MDDAVTSEATLVQRASSRDAEAFADLYELHIGRVFRYFYHRLGHRQDAEDLTEQVFLKAWQSIDGYDCRGVPFSAWLFRIAHNLLIDEKRSHRETAELDDTLEIADAASTPEELVLLRMEARELADALRQLSQLEQSVVALRFFEGLDHHAVAGIINKSEVASRSIQSRALARLAGHLRAREGGGAVLARVATALVALLLVFGITAATASESLPGSPLYSTKLALEDLRLTIATSDAERLQLHLDMSERRAAELSTVADSATAADIARVAGLYQEAVGATVREARATGETANTVARVDSALIGEEEQLKGTLARLGDAAPAKQFSVRQALSFVERERAQLRQRSGDDSLNPSGHTGQSETSEQPHRQQESPPAGTPSLLAPATEATLTAGTFEPTPGPSAGAEPERGDQQHDRGMVLDATPGPVPSTPNPVAVPVEAEAEPRASPTDSPMSDSPSIEEQRRSGRPPTGMPTATAVDSQPSPSTSAGTAGPALQQGADAIPGPSTSGVQAPTETPTETPAASPSPRASTAIPAPTILRLPGSPTPVPSASAVSGSNGMSGTDGSPGGASPGGRR